MSDGVDSVQGNGSEAVHLTQSLTAGRMLRNAREAVGLHVGALAVSMKVPVKKLEALEADRFDLLPDAVFVRALASSVCRTLKIDAAPVLDKLPRGHAPQLGPGSRSVNEPFYAYGKSGALSFPGWFSKPSALWVLVFLVATLAVFFLPEFQKFHQRGDVQTEDGNVDPQLAPAMSTNMPDDAALVLEPRSDIDVNAPPGSTLQSHAAQPVVTTPVTQQPMAGISKTVVGAVEQQTESARSIVGVSDQAAAGVLELKARGPTWVKVVDAKGAVQLMKILVAGESARVGGAAPLSVVVGAADSLDVSVRGVPLGLQALAKDNVARFEVK